MATLEGNVAPEDAQSQWVGEATIRGKSQVVHHLEYLLNYETTRLALLTICLSGLQFTCIHSYFMDVADFQGVLNNHTVCCRLEYD